jgi:hypothetical protein
MAMTAWAANVLRTASCLSESGPGASRTTLSRPIASPLRIMGMIVIARWPLLRKFRAPAANSAGASFTSGMSTILQSRMAAP